VVRSDNGDNDSGLFCGFNSLSLAFKKLLDVLKDILLNPAKYPEPMIQINRVVMLFLAIGIAQLLPVVSGSAGLGKPTL
jgi:hypothetical protein